MVDKTYNRDTWLGFLEKTIRESLYFTQLRQLHQENTDLIVRNIYYIPRIPVISVQIVSFFPVSHTGENRRG